MKMFSEKKAAAEAGPVLSRLLLFSWVVTIIAAIFQLVRYPQPQNLLCVGMAFAGLAMLTLAFRRPQVFALYPFSSLAIVGFGAARLVLPVIFISLDGHPVIYNLYEPVEDFAWTLGLLGLLLLSHSIYRSFKIMQRVRDWISLRFLRRIGIFSAPSDLQIWLIAIVGVAAGGYLYFFAAGGSQQGSNSSAQVSSLVKFFEGFIPFSYLPFIAVFPKLYDGRTASRSHVWARMAVFFTVLLVIAFASNSRSVFMFGLLSLGLAYLLGVILGTIRLRVTPGQIVLILTGLLLLAGPLRDLSTAMIVARDYRGEVSTRELVQITLDAYGNAATLRGARKTENMEGSESDYGYFQNSFLNRFCNVKFADSSLVAEKLVANTSGDEVMHETMRDIWWKHLLSTFPKPIIVGLGLPVNKDYDNVSSFGDELMVLATGNADFRGDYFTGDFVGVDLAAFGLWFLAVVFFFSIMLFVLIDSMALRPEAAATDATGGKNQANLSPMKNRPGPKLSVIGLLSVGTFFTMLSAPESTEAIAAYFVRYWWQTIILYAMLFNLTRFRL